MSHSDAETAARHMARALALAGQGCATTHPNPRVGCVVVRDGVVVGEGWHARAGEPHAEVHALRQAGARARGAEVFVTLEPCNHHGRTPPCTDALMAAGVARVWAAMTDPNPHVAGRGLQRLREAGMEVQTGLMHAEAQALNRGFVSRMTRQRPFVTLKLAASLDGRTAMASGESRWITSPEARADVHRLRAEAGCVLTSSNTVLADDPALTVRDWAPASACRPAQPGTGNRVIQDTIPDPRPPDRVVLDSKSRIPPGAKVWQPGARRFWVTSPEHLYALSLGRVSIAQQVEVLAVEGDATGPLSLPAVLALLALREVNEVLVECGPTLAGAFLQAGLVDEIVLYMAPTLIGHAARPLALLPGLDRLADRLHFALHDMQRVGPDVRLTLQPAAP